MGTILTNFATAGLLLLLHTPSTSPEFVHTLGHCSSLILSGSTDGAIIRLCDFETTDEKVRNESTAWSLKAGTWLLSRSIELSGIDRVRLKSTKCDDIPVSN